MGNRQPMGVGEWYHCYNRGVDKRRVFVSTHDYERFQSLLYVCNGTRKSAISDHRDTSLHGILANERINRGSPLVEVGAYALMPNHMHILLRQRRENGIAIFMQRLFTGYTMYFNIKNKRTGALFGGAFRSKHIPDDEYFKLAMAYVLLNPAELYERDWKKGIANRGSLEKKLLAYPYTSVPDFFLQERPERKIVSLDAVLDLYDKKPMMKSLLKEAQTYYAEAALTNSRVF
jgi:REP element-mobilizing transposase RayT